MIFLKSSILILILNFSLFNVAYPFFRKENSNNTIFFGFLILLTFLSFGYFFFDIKVLYLKYTFLIISLIFLLKNLRDNFFIKKYIQIFYTIILPIIFHSFLIQIYGEQFFIFRGNHYDSLNYTSMSVMMMNLKNSEILSIIQNFSQGINLHEDNFYINNAIIYFDGRPIVSLLNSIFYFPNYINLYEADFIFRTFLITLIPIAAMKFVQVANIGQNYASKFFISQIFTFSFWTIYILEINANSQLAAFGISIFFISYILENYKFFTKFDFKKNIIFSFISGFFFIIYAEQASIFFIIVFIFLLIKNFKDISNHKIYLNIIIFLIIFISLLLPHTYLLDFIVQQSGLGIKSKNDWWGYYGAFILGANNIVNESYHVNNIKLILKNESILNIFEYINNYNAIKYGNFYWLNIIPSLFGFYYINAIINNNLLIQYLISSFISLGLIYLYLKNLIQVYKEKNDYNLLIKIILLFSFIFLIILFYNLSFWSIIKFYLYMSPFIFFVIYKNFNLLLIDRENFLKIFLLLGILIMPFYKFSEFNHGVGKLDSFPSVLKLEMKKNYQWDFDPKNYLNCKMIFIKNYDKYIKTILSSKFSYYGLNNVKFLDNFENNNNNKCNLNLKNE